MKTTQKTHIGFIIFYIVFSLVFLALLELNKNTVVGWAAALALLAGATGPGTLGGHPSGGYLRPHGHAAAEFRDLQFSGSDRRVS